MGNEIRVIPRGRWASTLPKPARKGTGFENTQDIWRSVGEQIFKNGFSLLLGSFGQPGQAGSSFGIFGLLGGVFGLGEHTSTGKQFGGVVTRRGYYELAETEPEVVLRARDVRNITGGGGGPVHGSSESLRPRRRFPSARSWRGLVTRSPFQGTGESAMVGRSQAILPSKSASGSKMCCTRDTEPLVRRPDLAYSMENLLSLCTTCHARREAAERVP